MSFHLRINQAFHEENLRRKEAGEARLTKTDLWRAAKVTSAAATHWFNGDNAADLDTCAKIAPLLRVNAQWLFDGTGPRVALLYDELEEDHAPIRMIDAKASAGRGKVVYSDDVSKLLMFRRDWLAKKDAKPDQVLAFPVDGVSMVDAHIPHESVVLANTSKREPVSGKIYVLWIDGELYVKELVKDGDTWIARSHNKSEPDAYPDIPIDIDDRIVGRAFWCGFEM